MSTNITDLPFTKNFIWRFRDPNDVSRFDRFRDLSVLQGKEFESILLDFIDHYNHQNGVPFTLVNERELMERLDELDLSVSRMTLRNYRERGKLQDENGQPLFWTDGQQIRYNLQGTIEFFLRKKLSKAA